jgi:hypothetical protein
MMTSNNSRTPTPPKAGAKPHAGGHDSAGCLHDSNLSEIWLVVVLFDVVVNVKIFAEILHELRIRGTQQKAMEGAADREEMHA